MVENKTVDFSKLFATETRVLITKTWRAIVFIPRSFRAPAIHKAVGHPEASWQPTRKLESYCPSFHRLGKPGSQRTCCLLSSWGLDPTPLPDWAMKNTQVCPKYCMGYIYTKYAVYLTCKLTGLPVFYLITIGSRPILFLWKETNKFEAHYGCF